MSENPFILFIRDNIKGLKRNFLLAIAFVVFYGIEAYFLSQETFIGYGVYRPLIFLPALASIAFGPLVGAFVGGFGNLAIDFINDILVQGGNVRVGYLIDFVGYFAGAYIVGVLSVDIDVKSKGFLTIESIKDYLWNTLASVIGLAGVTGFIIGFGELLVGEVSTFNEALSLSGSITFWNGLFMLTLLIILPIYGYLEKVYIEKRERKLKEISRIKVVSKKTHGSTDIVGARFIDSTPIEKEWVTIGVTFRNLTDEPVRFRVEIIAPDIVQPSVKTTRMMGKGEDDEITFSLYPLDSGERRLKLRVMPMSTSASKLKEMIGKSLKEEYELSYKATPEESERVSSITSFLGVLVIFGLLVKTFYDLLESGSLSIGYTVALSLFASEVTIIVLWFLWKRSRLSS